MGVDVGRKKDLSLSNKMQLNKDFIDKNKVRICKLNGIKSEAKNQNKKI